MKEEIQRIKDAIMTLAHLTGQNFANEQQELLKDKLSPEQLEIHYKKHITLIPNEIKAMLEICKECHCNICVCGRTVPETSHDHHNG